MKTIAEFKETQLPEIPLDVKGWIGKLLQYGEDLEYRIAVLERQKYGRKSEKYTKPDNQPELGLIFNEVETTSDSTPVEEDSKEEDEVEIAPTTRKKRKKQIVLSETLEREVKVHELDENQRKCECCGVVMCEIGSDVQERLKIVPAKAVVEQNIYKKYACPNTACDTTPQQAPRAPVAIPKIKANEDTLAFIAIQKYLMASPLYRLEYLFKNIGTEISRHVMSRWMIQLAQVLKPVYKRLEEELLSRPYMHMDETTIQVLKEPGKLATSKSYMWLRSSGDDGGAIFLFHYDRTRAGAVAKELLGSFQGYLQTDDYGGYSTALNGSSGIIHLLCWDHARRYFWNAYQAIPEAKRTQTTADRILKEIAKLYKIEKNIKDLNDNDRLYHRQNYALPILNNIRKIALEKRDNLLDVSPTAKAIDYMMDNWEKLKIYISNPILNISNAPAERAIRPFAIGRKNWLFSDTPSGAEASAIIYSIVTTAKANGLDPGQYLAWILRQLPLLDKDQPITIDLLPIKRLVH